MTSPIDLTTVDAVKTYMGITGTDLDALLQQLITGLSQYVIDFCGGPIKSASYTEVYDGTGGPVLMLRVTPVTAVASVTVDRLALSYVNPATTSGVGYSFSTKALYLSGRNFTAGLRNVAVTYTGGYTTVPDSLAEAVVEAVAERAQRARNEGITSRSIAGESVTFTNGNVPQWAKDVFKLYRRVVPVTV